MEAVKRAGDGQEPQVTESRIQQARHQATALQREQRQFPQPGYLGLDFAGALIAQHQPGQQVRRKNLLLNMLFYCQT